MSARIASPFALLLMVTPGASAEIAWVQRTLNELGVPGTPLAVTGRNDKRTAAAIRWFQEPTLVSTGRPDVATVREMRIALHIHRHGFPRLPRKVPR